MQNISHLLQFWDLDNFLSKRSTNTDLYVSSLGDSEISNHPSCFKLHYITVGYFCHATVCIKFNTDFVQLFFYIACFGNFELLMSMSSEISSLIHLLKMQVNLSNETSKFFHF